MDGAPIGLLTAFALGLLDSLFGHSRALIAGYFLDARRPVSHAFWLALVLVVAHTFMLVGLTAVALYAKSQAPTGTVTHYLELLAAALMIGLGLWMVWRNWKAPSEECCHIHTHHHEQHEEEARAQSLGQVWVLGVSGGCVPCASGWAVLLQATGERRLSVAGGLLLAFSVGLGLSVLVLSLLARRVAGHFARRPWARRLPLVSALLVLAMGLISLAQVLTEHH